MLFRDTRNNKKIFIYAYDGYQTIQAQGLNATFLAYHAITIPTIKLVTRVWTPCGLQPDASTCDTSEE